MMVPAKLVEAAYVVMGMAINAVCIHKLFYEKHHDSDKGTHGVKNTTKFKENVDSKNEWAVRK